MMPTLLSLEALESDRAYVVQQLQEAREDVWGTVRSMWENRLAEIDEQIAALNVRQSNFASVALVFDGSPVVGSGDIRLDFAASALDAYQKNYITCCRILTYRNPAWARAFARR